jgi:hypothetical protein
MRLCPLPVDWLEYLEGVPSEDLSLHLAECRPCQLVVERIRGDLPNRRQVSSAPPPKLGSWPQWHSTRDASPGFCELWWSMPLGTDTAPDEPRVALLVLSNLWDEMGQSWCEVVPVSTDIENATSLDVILHRGDTDLGVPWRAMLRYQTVAERNVLDSRFGVLTEQGRTLMTDVMEGLGIDERFGSPVEGTGDPRLDTSERMARAMEAVGRAYAEMQEQGDLPASVMTRFTMHPPTRRIVAPTMALAAATASQEATPEREVDIPRRGRIRGRIEYRLVDDCLLFVIDEVEEHEEGFASPIRVVLWSRVLPTPQASDPFSPRPNEEVILVCGRGVLPADVSRLEVQIPDET